MRRIFSESLHAIEQQSANGISNGERGGIDQSAFRNRPKEALRSLP